VYDGYLVHSRSGGGSALSQAPLAVIAPPNPTAIRDDLDVPVFVYQTETDVVGSNLGARQDDTKMFRLWEGSGTSHYDTYGLVIGNNDVGDGQGAVKLSPRCRARRTTRYRASSRARCRSTPVRCTGSSTPWCTT
jgi:hypothetical protein